MNITVTMNFNSIDDLVEFYQQVRKDSPVSYVTLPSGAVMSETTIDKAISEGDFKSLADISRSEEAPVLPEPEPTPAPAEGKKPAPQKHSRNEVKQFCTKAHVEKNVNIKRILQQFGVSAFSALPDDRLDEFYDAVAAA